MTKKRVIDLLTLCAVLTLCVAWLLDNMVLLLVAGIITLAAFIAMVTADPRE